MNTLKTIVIGFLAGIAGAYAFFTYQTEDGTLSEANKGQYNVASYTPEDSLLPTVVTPRVNSGLANVDFSNAAELAIPSVVYINSISQSGVSYSYWDMLFNG
ncbi:MAG TPA: hypothetical protein PKN99_12840, partial [Cyclobacteriaceae bacterium]|nr:hypothetical protein [Cyclobacteriaceae bacterium]